MAKADGLHGGPYVKVRFGGLQYRASAAGNPVQAIEVQGRGSSGVYMTSVVVSASLGVLAVSESAVEEWAGMDAFHRHVLQGAFESDPLIEVWASWLLKIVPEEYDPENRRGHLLAPLQVAAADLVERDLIGVAEELEQQKDFVDLRLTPDPGQVVGWSGCQCELAAFVL